MMSVHVSAGFGGGGIVGARGTLVSAHTSAESGIEATVVATVSGSLASLPSLGQREPVYDTDNTDLGSELDEAEVRRELMHDKWRLLFDRFDWEGFGEILWEEFVHVLQHPEFVAQTPPHKREILLEKARSATSDAITFQEFVNVLSNVAQSVVVDYEYISYVRDAIARIAVDYEYISYVRSAIARIA